MAFSHSDIGLVYINLLSQPYVTSIVTLSQFALVCGRRVRCTTSAYRLCRDLVV